MVSATQQADAATGWPRVPEADGESGQAFSGGDAPVGWQAPITVADTTRVPGRPALHEVRRTVPGKTRVAGVVPAGPSTDTGDPDDAAHPEPATGTTPATTRTRTSAGASRLSGAYDVSRSAFDVAATALFTEAPNEEAFPMNTETHTDDTTVSDLNVDDVSRETRDAPPVDTATSVESVIPTAKHMRSAEIDSSMLRSRSARPMPEVDAPVASVLDEKLPRPAHTRVLTIANQKGGVGKTTTTVNIAAALALAGQRVLVIDMDPQGNASTALGVDHRAEVPSIYDVLIEERPLGEVIAESPDIAGLWCAPATIDLAGAEIELVSLVARESRLDRAIAALRKDTATAAFDYVLIDCPPSLGLLTVNAFVAAQEVFIPIQCEYYALEGLSQLLKNVEMIKKHLNPELRVGSILMTMYDARTRLSAQVADEVRAHFPEQVLKTRIPRSVRISEAPSFGQTVMSYDPASSGALSYHEAARELAARAIV